MKNMEIDDLLVDEIVRRVIAVASPDRIILFGSSATGRMNRDSDIDLLIMESNLENRREAYVRIREALRGMGYPFDIILITSKWFEESKDVIGGIAYPADKFGKVIYEAA